MKALRSLPGPEFSGPELREIYLRALNGIVPDADTIADMAETMIQWIDDGEREDGDAKAEIERLEDDVSKLEDEVSKLETENNRLNNKLDKLRSELG